MTRWRGPLGAVASVAVVGALLAAGIGKGYPAERANLLSGAAWLPSAQVGQLTLLDGASVEVAAQVRVAPSGTGLDVVQQGATAYALDRAAGAIRRVDGATFEVSPPATPVPGAGAQLAAFAAPDTVYAVDTGHGVLTTADARTLAVRTGPVPLAAQIVPEAATLDAAGRLWLVDTATGDLIWIEHGRRHSRRGATTPGAGLLALADGTPVLVDTVRRTAAALDPATGAVRHTTELDLRPGDRVRVSGSPHALRVYVVAARGLVSICELTEPTCRAAVPLVADQVDPGPAVEAGGRVFVPDYRSGQVWIIDLGRPRVVSQPRVLSPPAPFQLIARDGVVFFNDPQSERAGVIRLDGGVRPVAKYDPKSPDKGLTKQSGPETPRSSPPPPPGTPPPGQPPPGQPPPGQPPPPSQPGPPPPGGSGAPPALAIIVSTDRPAVHEPVNLRVTAARAPAPISAHWTFGDGTQADGLTTSHAWAVAQTFQVSVEATFPGQRTAVASLPIQVLPASAVPLTVQVTGTGTVSSQPAGIACPPSCTAGFPAGTSVTLTATPATDQGFGFNAWGGACSGSGGCTVTMATNRSVSAGFRDLAAPEDCFSYDPTRMHMVDLGPGGGGWELRSPFAPPDVLIARVDTIQDVQNARLVAEGFTTKCQITGAGGTMHYWKGGAGRAGAVSPESCFSYNPARLRIVEESPGHWRVTDGTVTFGGFFDSLAKAARGLRVAQQWRQECIIGSRQFLLYWR